MSERERERKNLNSECCTRRNIWALKGAGRIEPLLSAFPQASRACINIPAGSFFVFARIFPIEKRKEMAVIIATISLLRGEASTMLLLYPPTLH